MPTIQDITEVGSSLPSVEELKLEASAARTPSTAGRRKKKFWLVLAGTVMAISGLIPLLIISVQERKNSVKKTKANSSRDWQAADAPAIVIEGEDTSLANLRETSRLEDVMSFLSVTITAKEVFDDQTTPQYKAARWLADQDFLNMEIPNADPTDYQETFWFTQRYVLAVFYFSLGGEDWRYKSYFLSEFDVCDWNILFQAEEPPEGVDATQWTFGVNCNEDDEVTDILFTSNGLAGDLPAEMGDLLALAHISFFDNAITGNFPKRMRALKSLEFVSLEQNELSGPIPAWIQEWSALTYLNLSTNNLSGELPALAGLFNLVEVALDNNDLEGSIDAFNDVPSLEVIFLSDNEFEGFFGQDTWMDLPNLRTIDVSDNFLTGYVPSWVYDLERVGLNMNYLNNTGLPEVNRLDSPLEYFSVFGNDIEGEIPESLTNLESLTHLDLSDNFLTGYIPEDIFYLQDIVNLYLTDNDFAFWEIPDLSSSTWLVELGLADCNLNGTIPEWFGELTELQLLDLRDNELTGEIPEDFGYLTDLEWLLLNRNYLSGTVPKSLGDLPNLVTLFLDNNDLEGSADQVCKAKPEKLSQMVSDCNVECSCCTKCCQEGGDLECNNWEDTFRLSVEQERDGFVFSEDIVFNTGTDNAE